MGLNDFFSETIDIDHAFTEDVKGETPPEHPRVKRDDVAIVIPSQPLDNSDPPTSSLLPLEPGGALLNEINKVYNMECVEGMRQMPSNFVDLCITDPPYEVNYMAKIQMLRDMDHGTHKHNEESVDSEEHNVNIDWEGWAKELYRIMKDDTHLYVFWAEKQSHKLVPILEKVGFKFCQYLVWVKNRPSMDATWGHKYAYQHELCGFFQKGWRKLNRENSLRTILRYDIMGDQQNYKHPTQKPVKIIREFVTNSSNQGDLVFDGFMGSGTTAVASKQLKRNFIGFEISKHYCENVIKDRLEQEQLEEWFK